MAGADTPNSSQRQPTQRRPFVAGKERRGAFGEYMPLPFALIDGLTLSNTPHTSYKQGIHPAAPLHCIKPAMYANVGNYDGLTLEWYVGSGGSGSCALGRTPSNQNGWVGWAYIAPSVHPPIG